MSIQKLVRSGLPSLAYVKSPGLNPIGVFCPGFMSDMSSGKADVVERVFKKNGFGSLKFDYSDVGHSVNEGANVKHINLSFNRWRDDVFQVINEINDGPQIVVGSSMGAWMSLLAAAKYPEKVVGLVLIAPAVDFLRSFRDSYPQPIMDKLEKGETVWIPSQYGDYPANKKFFDEGCANEMLNESSIPVKCPVRIIHGMCDPDVPYKDSLKIIDNLQSDNVDLIYRKNGEHRMSTENDLQLLEYAINEVIKAAV